MSENTYIEADFIEPFAAVPNSLAQNPNVSAETLACVTYLISRGRKWRALVFDIRRRFNWGDHTWRKVSKEMRDLQILTLEKEGKGTKLIFNPWASSHDPLIFRPSENPPVENQRIYKERVYKQTNDINNKNNNVHFLQNALSETVNLKDNNIQKSTLLEANAIFERLWADYPVKKGKQKALAAFLKEANGKTLPELEDLAKRIYAGIWSMRQDVQWRREIKEHENWDVFIPNFPNGATWFANHRWNDEYETDREKFIENIRIRQKYRGARI